MVLHPWLFSLPEATQKHDDNARANAAMRKTRAQNENLPQ